MGFSFRECLKSKDRVCWGAAGFMARREEGEYPLWVFAQRITPPENLCHLNPKGVVYFSRLRCWLSSQSPLWGFSCLAALDAAKITSRKPCPYFSNTLSAEPSRINALKPLCKIRKEM